MQFRILGPLEVDRSGQVVGIGGARQQRALALLVVNANSVVPFGHLVDVLWEEPPQSTRQQVYNVIGSLRRTLQAASNGAALVTADAGYRLSVPPDSVDAYRFQTSLRAAEKAEAERRHWQAVEHLKAAVALWRGPALDGLEGGRVAGIAARLNEQRLTAVERLTTLRLQLGEHDSLTGELLELVAEHPLRESLRHDLMLALARSGRQAEALNVYEQGRRLLADELGISPGRRLRRLHELILTDDVDLAQPAPAVVGRQDAGDARATHEASRRHSAPHTLPRDTVDFTGRVTETGLLLDAARAPRSALTVVTIDGMGGVGKTTLALRVAHQLAEEYMDGQYYIDLHGFSTGVNPLTTAQALDTLLTEHGTPAEAIPADLAGKSALWRSSLAGRRAMIVLDNVLDVSQVLPLLPGTAEAFVVLTCRRRRTVLDGTIPVSLDVLPHTDAVALFTRIAGEDRVAGELDSVREVVRLCGYLPLALRIAAARFRDRSTWSVSDLVNRLRGHQERTRFLEAGNRSVMAVLALSYRYLRPNHQQVFRALSLHPGEDFDVAATAAITELSFGEAEQALEVLFEDNLLLRSTGDRFRFHDLVHDCAYSLATEHDDEGVRTRTQHRILDYYLYSAAAWSGDLALGAFRFTPQVTHVPEHVSTPGSDGERVEFLSAEYRNLLSVARFAAANGWYAHSCQLPRALQPFLKLQNYGDDALELFENALLAARTTGDSDSECAALTGLALVHRERGASPAASRLLQQAIDISHERGDKYTEAFQLGDLAAIHTNNDRIHDAYEVLGRANQIASEAGNPQVQAVIANNLGVACLDLGRYAEAFTHLQTATELHANQGSALAGLLTLWNIGRLRHLQTRHQEAIAIFERVLGTSRDLSYPLGEALALVGLCTACRSIGELTRALECGREALSLARRFNLQELECDALNSIGEALASLGELENARATFVRAGETADEHGFRRYVARAVEGLAHVSAALGDTDGAREHWENALRLYPGEIADAQNSQIHLLWLDKDSVVCAQCRISTIRPDNP